MSNDRYPYVPFNARSGADYRLVLEVLRGRLYKEVYKKGEMTLCEGQFSVSKTRDGVPTFRVHWKERGARLWPV